MITSRSTSRAFLLLAASSLPFAAQAQDISSEPGIEEEEDVIVVTGSRRGVSWDAVVSAGMATSTYS